MLNEIRVSQFAIIDQLQIPFYSGLNIISGETGAGKSILIKSLGLLMGGKSSQKDIRDGCDQAVIEGSFDLQLRNDIRSKMLDMGLQCEDDVLVVRRVLQKSGKSRIYINGHLSTIGALRQLVCPLVTLSNPTEAPLIEITGQHENKNLTSTEYQMELLDQFCKSLDLREKCTLKFEHWRSLNQQLDDLNAKSMEREQRMDFLRFQIEEIQSLELQDGEDEKLHLKIQRLREQSQWQDWFRQCDESFSGSRESVLSQLAQLQNQAPNRNLPELQPFFTQLSQAIHLLEDCSFELNKAEQSLDDDDGYSLDELESRLSRIRKLQKKFGDDLADILTQLDSMTSELHELSDFEKTRGLLQKDIAQSQTQLLALCQQLSKKRTTGAKKLGQQVNRELADLNMKGLSFSIAVGPLAQPGPRGQDKVEFLVQNSKSETPRAMGKTASGGELSRILLSIKQVLGKSNSPRTFLFDEVDTGVSGQTAERVGAKLQHLAQGQQVLCVTHLPQVACYGDFHFYIEKHPKKSGVEMSLNELKSTERVREIARLISGEKITKTSLAHARQLLQETRP